MIRRLVVRIHVFVLLVTLAVIAQVAIVTTAGVVAGSGNSAVMGTTAAGFENDTGEAKG